MQPEPKPFDPLTDDVPEPQFGAITTETLTDISGKDRVELARWVSFAQQQANAIAALREQVTALRDAHKVVDAPDDVPPVEGQDAVATDAQVAATGRQVDEPAAITPVDLAVVGPAPEPVEATVDQHADKTTPAPVFVPSPQKYRTPLPYEVPNGVKV